MKLRADRRAERQTEATERNAAYAKRTTREKLASLPVGGAARQHRVLHARLQKEQGK